MNVVLITEIIGPFIDYLSTELGSNSLVVTTYYPVISAEFSPGFRRIDVRCDLQARCSIAMDRGAGIIVVEIPSVFLFLINYSRQF